MGEGADNAFQSGDSPNLAQFQRLDQRVRYLNQKGIIADLILAGGSDGLLTKLFPSWEQRRRFVRYLVARYAAMNVTWLGLEHFEDYPDGRALLKEVGGLLKQLDGYQRDREHDTVVCRRQADAHGSSWRRELDRIRDEVVE